LKVTNINADMITSIRTVLFDFNFSHSPSLFSAIICVNSSNLKVSPNSGIELKLKIHSFYEKKDDVDRVAVTIGSMMVAMVLRS